MHILKLNLLLQIIDIRIQLLENFACPSYNLA